MSWTVQIHANRTRTFVKIQHLFRILGIRRISTWALRIFDSTHQGLFVKFWENKNIFRYYIQFGNGIMAIPI